MKIPKPGSIVEIETRDGKYEGILMESSRLENDNFLIIK